MTPSLLCWLLKHRPWEDDQHASRGMAEVSVFLGKCLVYSWEMLSVGLGPEGHPDLAVQTGCGGRNVVDRVQNG